MMRSRLWRVSPFALLMACASCSGGTDRTPAASPGESHQGDQAGTADTPSADGPGLQQASADSLKLPVARAFDLSHVEPRYFAAALGQDPNRIFEFVRDRIAFEPYRGCLRGPRGTLMAMAGNAVDRAALLGSMLSSSGQHVRYAHGKLKESAARDLVASIWAERPSASDAAPPSPELQAALGRFLDGIHRDASLLVTTLRKAGLPARRSAALTRDRLVQEAQDHYWVEWEQNGQWMALDPSFATSTPGQRYAEAEATFDELPDSVFHHVDMRLRIEEGQDAQATSRALLDYGAKAADLSGVDLFLSHVRVQSDEGTMLRPVLAVGQDTVIGLAYSVAAPRAAAQASGALADALAGDAESAGPPLAGALFVEFDLVAPDGGKETVVREIFNRAAVAGPTKPEELPRAVYDFFVTTGAVQEYHLSDVTSLSAPGARPTIGSALRMINIADAAISDALTGRIADSAGTVLRTYPDAPRISVAELSDWKGTPRLSLDLRRDRPRVAVSGFDARRLFVAEVFRGVVAAAVEREVVGLFAAGNTLATAQWAPAMSTNLAFERAQAAKIESVLLSGTSSALSKDVPADARARIDKALAAGQVVVAPKRPVDIGGAQRFAWWSVDPSSGATTAVTDEGLNQGTAEGIVTRTSSGEVTIEIRSAGTTFDFFKAKDAQQAVHWVKNITSNYGNLSKISPGLEDIVIEWHGLHELWGYALLGL